MIYKCRNISDVAESLTRFIAFNRCICNIYGTDGEIAINNEKGKLSVSGNSVFLVDSEWNNDTIMIYEDEGAIRCRYIFGGQTVYNKPISKIEISDVRRVETATIEIELSVGQGKPSQLPRQSKLPINTNGSPRVREIDTEVGKFAKWLLSNFDLGHLSGGYIPCTAHALMAAAGSGGGQAMNPFSLLGMGMPQIGELFLHPDAIKQLANDLNNSGGHGFLMYVSYELESPIGQILAEDNDPRGEALVRQMLLFLEHALMWDVMMMRDDHGLRRGLVWVYPYINF